MGDVIKDYNTEELIDYLQRRNLKLDDDFAILRKQKIDAKFVEELNEQKLRAFSSYKTIEELKEVLRKYKVNGGKITCINQFNPVFKEINDDNKALKQCMKEIILRLSNLETMQDSTNEATRCVFITSILNVSIAITRKLTNEEKIYIAYQDDVSGEDTSGRVDYSIKGKRTAEQAFQNDDDYLYGIVSTATEWHFIKLCAEGLYCTSKSEYRINLSKTALKKDIESIRKGVKKLLK
ncbi:hypothetical protein Glove_508g87 [Diversispora epigaea]|uniref:Uncharacterized protein n=1 Tax=Diversispora epigaea TaxID=1348612 RepID=A0A397GG07_9GLOM|nr:hypothetical protein Glove_508g87 [Diversispora epigaea]